MQDHAAVNPTGTSYLNACMHPLMDGQDPKDKEDQLHPPLHLDTAQLIANN
jgi:hypothetical protein